MASEPEIINVKVLQLNVDKSKLATLQLIQLAEEQNTEIILIQEPYCEINTYKGEKSYLPLEFNGFHCQYAKVNKRPYSIIYTKNTILASVVPGTSDQFCTYIQIPANNDTGYIYIASIYSPPTNAELCISLHNLLENTTNNQLNNSVICGDFNAKSTIWGNQRTDSKGTSLEIVMFKYNFHIINPISSPPTFENTQGGKSWIDLTFAGLHISPKIKSWDVLSTESLSFHKIISFNISTKISLVNKFSLNLKRTNWDEVNIELVNQIASNNTFEQLDSELNKEQAFELLDKVDSDLNEILIQTIKNNTPLPKPHNYKANIWWSKELNDMRKENNRLRRKAQRTKNEQTIQEWKTYLASYKNKIKQSKWESFKNFANDCKDPWDFVKKTIKKTSNDNIPCLRRNDGSFTTTAQETSELLLENMFSNDDIETDTPYHKTVRECVNNFTNDTLITEYVPTIDIKEMTLIFEMSPYKSAPNNLLPVVFQKCYESIKSLIMKFFNKCLYYQYYPKNWKKGFIKILKKPNKGDAFHHKSYRSITLLPVIGKWFSKIINKRLQWHCETEIGSIKINMDFEKVYHANKR